jgi:DinB superfamily
MDPDLLVENEIERDRLTNLVDKLSDDDLALDLGGGWTVGVALAHLAFWDERAALLLERYVGGTPQHHIPDWYEDMLNQTLEPQWQALPPRAAAEGAVAAAEHVTRALRVIEDELCARLEAHEDGYLLRRFNHRREHIEQIEAALG